MFIDKTLSEKINILKLLLMINIVFIHGTMVSNTLISPDITIYLYFQRFFSLIIGSSCVPTFFLISGFLLFNRYENSIKGYSSLLKKKISSLLVPYVLWNLIVFCIYFFGPKISLLSNYFDNSKLSASSVWSLLSIALGITTTPLVFQFWFIQHLMIYILLTPLFAYILKHYSYPFILSVFLVIWLKIEVHYSIEIFCFFSGAMVCKLNSFSDVRFFNKHKIIIPLLFLSISFLRLFDLITDSSAGIILGIIVFVLFAELLWRSIILRTFLLYIAPGTFFLYASHGIIIVFLRKIYLHIFLLTNISLFIGYIFCSLATIFICLNLFFLMRKKVNVILSVLSGNRLT